MITNRHIRAVVEYLNGGMTPDEQHAFQQRLERDGKLRKILNEEEQINRALLHDKETIPILGPPAFDRFLHRLNTTAVGQEGGNIPQQGLNGLLPNGSNGFGNKQMVIGLALVGLTAGGLISTIPFGSQGSKPIPQPAATSTAPRMAPPQMTAPADTAIIPATAEQLPEQPRTPSETAPAGRNGGAAATATLPKEVKHQEPRAHGSNEEEEMSNDLKRQEQGGADIIKSDSVRARLKVNPSNR